MNKFGMILVACGAFILTRPADAAQLQPGLAGLSFLLGAWHSGVGQVAETGETSKGLSVITSEAGGAVLLRRDHTELFDKTGKPDGGFDQIMTIYDEAESIRADYFDGTHVIHYTAATVMPGKSVTFITPATPEAPQFRLSYKINGRVLAVNFAMAPPGQTRFQPIASGTLQKTD